MSKKMKAQKSDGPILEADDVEVQTQAASTAPSDEHQHKTAAAVARLKKMSNVVKIVLAQLLS